MNKRRIFIAIDLPDKVKKRLISFQEKWFDLPVRWTRKSNLHITLVFIGYTDDGETLEICRLARQVAEKHRSFEINFNEICLMPPGRPPRMIWLAGEKNAGLIKLRNDLEEKIFNSIGKDFNPHITLGRIKQNEWRKLSKRPDVREKVGLVVPVEQIKVMESHLFGSGSEYVVLESIELKI